MENRTIPTGRPCWYELLTTDAESALTFYTELFGWGAHDFQAGEHPYTSWMNGGTPIGGMMEMPPSIPREVPPHWLMYVSTPDVDAFTAKAEGLGGGVLNRIDIDGVGRIAIVSDPASGGCFAAYQPADEAPGHDQEPRIGEVSWHELATEDVDEAWSFYSEMCGWERSSDFEIEGVGPYMMFKRGEKELGGMFARPPEMPACMWLNYFRVEDARAAAARVGELGGKVVEGPMEVPDGDMVAVCADAQGARFAVHSTATG
ncbi:MAG: VOC family protein [Gemmatimonadetes bacterium]|nr:VOC family protein [Gemmatimonadota bacterium]